MEWKNQRRKQLVKSLPLINKSPQGKDQLSYCYKWRRQDMWLWIQIQTVHVWIRVYSSCYVVYINLYPSWFPYLYDGFMRILYSDRTQKSANKQTIALFIDIIIRLFFSWRTSWLTWENSLMLFDMWCTGQP